MKESETFDRKYIPANVKCPLTNYVIQWMSVTSGTLQVDFYFFCGEICITVVVYGFK